MKKVICKKAKTCLQECGAKKPHDKWTCEPCPFDKHVGCVDVAEEKILFEDGQPCKHNACLNHLSHPCEGCGRIAGSGNVTENPFMRDKT